MKTLKNTHISDCCKASYRWTDEINGICDKCNGYCEIIYINNKGEIETL